MFCKGCPPGPADPLTVGLGLSGAIFLVGLLLLLIWKLLTMLYDKMEYSKFESEIQNPAWEKVKFHTITISETGLSCIFLQGIDVISFVVFFSVRKSYLQRVCNYGAKSST